MAKDESGSKPYGKTIFILILLIQLSGHLSTKLILLTIKDFHDYCLLPKPLMKKIHLGDLY